MSKRFGVSKVVYRDEIDAAATECRPHHIAPDSPEPVYTDFDTHLKQILPDFIWNFKRSE